MFVGILHPDVVNPANAWEDNVSGVLQLDVLYVDVEKEFNIEYEFTLHDYIFKWVFVKGVKLRCGIIIGRFVFDFVRRPTFTTMRCKKKKQYKESIKNLKYNDTKVKDCECLF